MTSAPTALRLCQVPRSDHKGSYTTVPVHYQKILHGTNQCTVLMHVADNPGNEINRLAADMSSCGVEYSH